MTHEEKLRQLAGEARSYFEYRKRYGNEDGYWTLEEGAPEWVRKLAFAAHKEGKILPDDFRYLFIVEALEAIAENPKEPESMLEPDVYTSQLLAWLDAYPSYRMDIVDAAVDQFGWNGLFEALEAGQLMEKKEVLALVRAFLEKKLEEED